MSDPQLFQRAQKAFYRQPFLSVIGVEMESIEKGKSVFTCRLRPELTQHHGFMHGGVIAALADTTCGFAAFSVLPEGLDLLTVECKVQFLRPANAQLLVSTGSVLKAGKRLIITEADICDSTSGKRIAKAITTMIPIAAVDRA